MNTWRLVKNEPCYWEFIREVRNDPKIKIGFVDQITITPEQQRRYMEKHNNEYYICIDITGIPLGFIGEVNGDIRVAVKKQHQKKGIGRFMVLEFTKLHPNSYAKMKHNNMASKKLFESCGFSYTGKDESFYYYKK